MLVLSSQPLRQLLLLAVSLAALLATCSAFDSSTVCVSYKYSFSCAVRRTDLRAVCWHHYSGETRYSPPDFQYTSIACSGPELMGILADGALASTTYLFDGQHDAVWDAWRTTSASTNITHGALASDRVTTCYIVGKEYTSTHTAAGSGQLVCWPNPTAYEAHFPDSYSVVSVAETTCLEEGSCSADDWELETAPVCAIKADDGSLHCCCGSADFMAGVPTQPGFVDVSISARHGCAVLADGGGMVCWGSNTANQATAPNIPNGSGGSTAEGAPVVDVNGNVLEPSELEVVDPSQITTVTGAGKDVYFTQVAVSDSNSCGIFASGKALCWGTVGDNLVDLPAPACKLESVAINGYVGCGRLVLDGATKPLTPAERADAISRTVAQVSDAVSNGTAIGISPGTVDDGYLDRHYVVNGLSTGVYCWHAFPEEFVGLERPSETWEIIQRKVPIDLRPSLSTTAGCMGLATRESEHDITRIQAVAISMVIVLALGFSLHRMMILRRFGDFSFADTVLNHQLYWFGFFNGVLDMLTLILFVIMDIAYISFRALYMESEYNHPLLLYLCIGLVCYSVVALLGSTWTYARDEYARISIHSPEYIAKRRLALCAWLLFSVDMTQWVVLGLYAYIMLTAGIRPSVTFFACLATCTLGPLYMLAKNYQRVKHAQASQWEGVVRRKSSSKSRKFSDLGHLAGSSRFGGRSARVGIADEKAVPSPSQAQAQDLSRSIAVALNAKQTNAKLAQLARAASKRTMKAFPPERQKHPPMRR